MGRIVDHSTNRTLSRKGRYLHLHIIPIIVRHSQCDVLGQVRCYFLTLIRRHRHIVRRHRDRHRRRVCPTIAIDHLIHKTITPCVITGRRVLHHHTVLVIRRHLRREIIVLRRTTRLIQRPPRRILLPEIIQTTPHIIPSGQYQSRVLARGQPTKPNRPRHLRRQIHINVIHTIRVDPTRQRDRRTRVQQRPRLLRPVTGTTSFGGVDPSIGTPIIGVNL